MLNLNIAAHTDFFMKALNRSKVTELTTRPERILQFGEGNFLRAFVQWIVQRMNRDLDFDSSVAIVQPIAQGLDTLINAQDGLYHLILEGMEDAARV